MSDNQNQKIIVQYNLFALILLRKEIPNTYEFEQEIRIAHLQTRLNIGRTGESNIERIEFYDVTRHMLQHVP